VSGGQQPLKGFCTADILWRAARSCSRCSDVLRQQNSLHEKRLCLAPHSSRARPHRALTVVRARKKKLFSDTVLPKERDERLATVVCLTFYSLVVTICTASLTLTNSTFCPQSCIYLFCVHLRTNSDYFPTQH
jgi:hypothetical protein